MNSIYLLKVKGTAKIPDYIQVRDAKFALIGYFRFDRPERFKDLNLNFDFQEFTSIITTLPFGAIYEFKKK